MGTPALDTGQRTEMTNMRIAKTFAAIVSVAGVLVVATAVSSVAAPVSTGAAVLKSADTSDIVDVRWRRGWGWGVGGFAAGVAVGSLAARPYYPYYYDPYYAPPPPAVYAPGPGYVQPYPDPNGPVRQCWVTTDRDRGFGYYRPC